MMSRRNDSPEFNDPALKLFGRSIFLPESHAPPPEEYVDAESPQLPPAVSDSQVASPRAIKMQEEPCLVEDSDNEDGAPTSGDPETESPGQKSLEAVDKNTEASKADAFKKPDKILPCPRCNNMDTKFCYFNNYNVNQPRHFCRNCQRYWTAGGAIRNVPVGAGRRKGKHSTSQLQDIVVPSTDLHCITSSEMGEVLRVNPDSPLYRSIVNQLSLKDPENILGASKVANGPRAGFPSPSSSSMRENEVSQIEKVGPPLHTLQGFPGPPPYPWNFGWNGMTAYGGAIPSSNAFLIPWNSPTMVMSPPGFCVPNIPFPFVSPMPWGWDAASNPASCTNPSEITSPLGKHSRDLNSQDEEKNEKSLWIPKTLRIDDPEAAAKSSIWSTLGIRPGKNESFSKGGMFKAFQSPTEGKPERSESNKALEANPAALSRSNAFQETT